jgi:hypothetical protein
MSKQSPKLKIVTGYRKDQEYTIDASEAHKAYYLFLNPNERGVFDNGVAVEGSNIDSIKPDYNASMGWNPNYELDADDMNHVRKAGMDRKTRQAMSDGKEVARVGGPDLIDKTLAKAKEQLDLIEAGGEEIERLTANKTV